MRVHSDSVREFTEYSCTLISGAARSGIFWSVSAGACHPSLKFPALSLTPIVTATASIAAPPDGQWHRPAFTFGLP
jgi:hypothetical protein